MSAQPTSVSGFRLFASSGAVSLTNPMRGSSCTDAIASSPHAARPSRREMQEHVTKSPITSWRADLFRVPWWRSTTVRRVVPYCRRTPAGGNSDHPGVLPQLCCAELGHHPRPTWRGRADLARRQRWRFADQDHHECPASRHRDRNHVLVCGSQRRRRRRRDVQVEPAAARRLRDLIRD